MAEASWADLSLDLLLLIAQRLNLADAIRLQATCSCWARALGKKTCSAAPIFRPSPWLLVPNDPRESPDFCNSFSLSDDRCYEISSFPQISRRRFVGSSPDGWLVAIDHLFTPRLLNPLTRQALSLPSLFTLGENDSPACPDYYGSLSWGFYDEFYKPLSLEEFASQLTRRYIRKIILTSSPLRGGTAVAFCNLSCTHRCLAFAKAGDEAVEK